MDARLLARLLGTGRIAFGALLAVAPELSTGAWLGRDAKRAGTKVAVRGLGVRDVVLGAGALASPDGQLGPWLAGGVAADVVDLVATIAAGDALPTGARVLVGTLAAGGASVGLAALAGLSGASGVQ